TRRGPSGEAPALHAPRQRQLKEPAVTFAVRPFSLVRSDGQRGTDNGQMADLIQPRTLQGFRDYPPELMIPRERLMEKARQVYRSYGFAPIDTPALEYAEILVGKGGEESDRLIYR